MEEITTLPAISIHTALAGCDINVEKDYKSIQISIHTALAGCDITDVDKIMDRIRFQSTQPSQAVTFPLAISESDNRFQSTQPSQAVTRCIQCPGRRKTISIHTALAGCDFFP